MEIYFLWCSTQILSSKYHTLALWKESRKYHSSGQFEFMSGPTKHKNIQRKPHKNSGSIVNAQNTKNTSFSYKGFQSSNLHMSSQMLFCKLL